MLARKGSIDLDKDPLGELRLAPIRQKCMSPVRSWASHFNGHRHFDRRPVVTLRMSYRFMAQTALEPHLMLANDNFLD